MKTWIKAGVTDRTELVFIPDPAATDGSGKTGLVAANLTVSYVRVETDNDVTVTDATGSLNDLSALTDAHADWGLKEVSSALAPGLYRLDIADAVFASGAWRAVVYVMITSSAAAASPMEFILGTNDPLESVAQAGDSFTRTYAKGTDITGFNDLSAAAVNAEVVDALATDTYPEPGQGAPAATASLTAKIGYLFKAWRNRKDNDGTTTQMYADDGATVDQKQTTSQAAGVVTKGEIVSGP